MQCHRSVKQISSDLPAIHCYFDLCPESPDGERVLYFEFTGEVPGPGNIVVARTDGSDRRIVAEVPWGSAHEAVFQQWTGPDEVAFRKADAGAVSTVIVSLTGGAAREIAMPVRMFSPDGKWGLSSPHQIRKHRATGRDGVVYLVDTSSGETRDLFTRDDVLSIHPLADDIEKPAVLEFTHTKWSHDGRRIFVVFTNEPYRKKHPELMRVKSIVVAESDGTGLRYLKEFGHHPMWNSDGTLITSFDYNAEGGQDLVAQPIDGGEPRLLLSGAQGCHPTLSADGKSVLSDTLPHGAPPTSDVVIYHLDTGETEILATMRADDFSHGTGCHPHPAWSRDEKSVYFNSADTGLARLYRAAEQVTSS